MTGKQLFRVVVCVLILSPVPVWVAERPHLASQPRDGAIAADGRFDDWSGSLQPLGSDPVAIQAVNDGEFLYLRLTASEGATRMQIMRQGMTVWFDPAGGTKKKFGIRYPVSEARDPGDGGMRRGRPADDDAAPADRVDIVGPGKDDARSLTRDHLSGVEVAVRTEEGVLHYELKVPLTRTSDHPYAIDAQPGSTIGLGLETAKMRQRSFGEGRGGGFGGGGMGGRGGGMGGRGGGRGGHGGEGGGERGGFQPPKPLKTWATLSIATVR